MKRELTIKIREHEQLTIDFLSRKLRSKLGRTAYVVVSHARLGEMMYSSAGLGQALMPGTQGNFSLIVHNDAPDDRIGIGFH
jgi:hypothetical protein